MHVSGLIAQVIPKKLVALYIHSTLALSLWLFHRQAALIFSSENVKFLFLNRNRTWFVSCIKVMRSELALPLHKFCFYPSVHYTSLLFFSRNRCWFCINIKAVALTLKDIWTEEPITVTVLLQKTCHLTYLYNNYSHIALILWQRP